MASEPGDAAKGLQRHNIHGATFHSQELFFLTTRTVLPMQTSKGEPELYQLNIKKSDNAIFNAVLHSYLLGYPAWQKAI